MISTLKQLEFILISNLHPFHFLQDNESWMEMKENQTDSLQLSHIELSHFLSNSNSSTLTNQVSEKLSNPEGPTFSDENGAQFEPCSDWLISFWNRLLIFIFYQV